MKIKVNIREHLLRQGTPTGYVLAHADIDINDIFETNDIPDEQEIDLYEILDRRRAIALVWDTEMLLSHYQHLTEDQAWEVLKECERHYNAERGLTWDDVAEVVCERFPEPEQRALPPDPDGQNDDRAAWANAGIKAFRQATGTDVEDALPDLLCDLMHWADRRDYDFGAALDRARGHYADETKGA